MQPKKFARIGGTVMLILGLLALIPSLSSTITDDLPALRLETSYGWFLGLFAMNIINKLALIAFGILGIAAASSTTRSLPMSINFSRLVFYVMGAGAILGLIPATQTFFGYWPLFGGEVLVHAIFAGLGAYAGYSLTQKASRELRQTFPDLKAEDRKSANPDFKRKAS